MPTLHRVQIASRFINNFHSILSYCTAHPCLPCQQALDYTLHWYSDLQQFFFKEEKKSQFCVATTYLYTAIISHYKPRLVFFFYPFFTKAVAYTADNLCSKQGNVVLKSVAYKRERLQIKSGLWWRVYGSIISTKILEYQSNIR